ncbi:RNA helicase [Spironucleus salmonicida]|uniref:ATP-dependent RNA helicase n=1 Tax=Spironucleus salmonicida TaxID=348837 RepID=V6LLC8_9EUKA|nr:RNA helicase [Spironucleus salmonicida]|eukprot:EST45445.1 ATP-dependent RNA helicase [Spironucleus salmonicida]
MSSFSDLNLNPKLLAQFTEKFAFTQPKPIQAQIIPNFHNEFPLIFQAETGSGKTLAYVLPILSYYYNENTDFALSTTPKVLFLAPTRVLARQIFEIITLFDLPISSFIGGESHQNTAFFVVATPGKALFEEELFKKLDFLVLDEADRLVQMEDCRKFLHTQKKAKLVMSSATVEGIKMLGKIVKLTTDTNEFLKPNSLQISYSIVPIAQKYEFLVDFIRKFDKTAGKLLIFTLTCAGSRFIAEFLKKTLKTEKIFNLNGKQHSQVQVKNLNRFMQSTDFAILITTDIAARGLDVESVSFVLQFDPPQRLETLVHRAGRAGRNTRDGKCLILVDNDEIDLLEMLQNRGIFMKKEEEMEQIQRNFSDSKKIQFYKKELKKQRKSLEIETQKGVGKSILILNAQIKELEEKISVLEAEEAEFNKQKMEIFELPSSKILREMQCEDRGIFDLAQEAFIAMVRAYQEYEMKYIFDFKKVDLGQLAMSMGLLKLPSMKELKSGFIWFKGSDVDINSINYLDSSKEKLRQERKIQREEKVEKQIKEEVKVVQAPTKKIEPLQKPTKVFNNQKFSAEYDLLQKFKKGYITEEELEKLL